jgi:hypothetical protein
MLGKTVPSEFTTLLDRRGHVEVVFSSTVDSALFRVDNDFVCAAQLGRGECQLKKLILVVGVILLCIGTAAGLFLFLISLPGGPGTQGQIDWIEILTSPAPAYLPWKIFTITCILGFVLTMVGLIAKSRK